MAKKAVRLQVSTPHKTVLDADVDFVLLRTVEGDMGVLAGHEPSAVRLDYGLLRADIGGETAAVLAVLGGFAVIGDNRVTVTTALAEPPDRMEEALAARELERIENRRREEKSDLEMQRAEAALRRTLVGMDVSAYTIIRGAEKPAANEAGDE